MRIIAIIFVFAGLAVSTVRVSAQRNASSWSFAVSGDSRNCGDVVMPAIAAGVHADHAQFYWHLGDFRAITDYDEDILAQKTTDGQPRKLTVLDYLSIAWPDFIEHQLLPFAPIPVFLAIGNHELVLPKTRDEYLSQFADWIDTPTIRAQRLKDDPKDHRLKTYYHWVQNGTDFIALDNGSADQFSRAQVAWVKKVIARDETDASIKSVVVGMHEALPESLAKGHSMSDYAQGEQSGIEVYKALWHAHNSAGKRVYVLASHSHFLMENVFNTEFWNDAQNGAGVLPGWIIGTAGAVRYRLPADVSRAGIAKTSVYGYLLGTVAPDGSITFRFHELEESDLVRSSANLYSPDAVHGCFAGNSQATH